MGAAGLLTHPLPQSYFRTYSVVLARSVLAVTAELPPTPHKADASDHLPWQAAKKHWMLHF